MTPAVRSLNTATVALWCGVILLVSVGFAGSVVRAVGVLESAVFSDAPVPELSRLDRGSALFMAMLLGVERGTPAFREIDAQNRRMLGKFNGHPTATLLHVLPAALLVILAPLQFSRRIRSRHIQWHRWSGRVIVAIAIPVGFSGLFFGLLMPFAGTLEASAIAVFGGVFLFSLMRAFIAIRRGDVARHREWMIRMFSVVLGIGTVRIVGILLAVLTRDGPEAWFGYSVWIGFASTVAIAELWIRYTRPSSRRMPATGLTIVGADERSSVAAAPPPQSM